jgi:hypothetical protein
MRCTGIGQRKEIKHCFFDNWKNLKMCLAVDIEEDKCSTCENIDCLRQFNRPSAPAMPSGITQS